MRRTMLLLRCQQAREQRRRVALLAAERVHADASATAGAAAAARQAQAATAVQMQHAAHDGLRGRVVAPTALAALSQLEGSLADAAEACASREHEAKALLAEAGAALAEAREALAREARISAKRARLADGFASRYRRARELAEEAARDDDRADAWRAS